MSLSVLVEEAVWVIKTCLLKTEIVRSLWQTVHVGGVHSEVETDRVSLDRSAGLLLDWLFASLWLGSWVRRRGLMMDWSLSVMSSWCSIIEESVLMVR